MIEIRGLNELKAKLERIKNIEQHAAPLMRQIGETLKNEIEQSFDDEKSPFGQKWQALKPSTLNIKAKKGKSEKILRSSGDLADKWLIKSNNNESKIFNNSNVKGFAYGLTHQFGTTKAGRSHNVKIPARPFLPVDKSGNLAPKSQQMIKNEVVEFLKKL
ncbi:phage virion morphogenesis protein [Campylobacter sp. 9BO]|uniref:phage virion morphogenesis protein n=1 Tax=Campylobacter sp. 9BO TaxID=3424759 RepID=UPI003D33C252